MEENDEELDPQEKLMKIHRLEKQELQDKIQALKKTASKGDKKKKKEINAEIVKLEGDLNEKHSAELMDLMLNSVTLEDNEDEFQTEDNQDDEENNDTKEKVSRVSKAQKRRDKKAEKQKQRLQEIEAEEQENLNGARHREQERIKELLESRGLELCEIPSDGDCMFAGIVHQLGKLGEPFSVSDLRRLTGEEMIRNKETYWPFLSNTRTGDMLTDSEYNKYCSDISNTPMWGGQVELRALSTVLGRPLEVVQAEGQASVLIGEEQTKEKLVLTYHRHMYGLGEHYNSVLKKL